MTRKDFWLFVRCVGVVIGGVPRWPWWEHWLVHGEIPPETERWLYGDVPCDNDRR